MAIQFSFKYCIDPKVHKTEEDIKAIAVGGAIKAKAPIGWQGLAGSDLQGRGVPSEH